MRHSSRAAHYGSDSPKSGQTPHFPYSCPKIIFFVHNLYFNIYVGFVISFHKRKTLTFALPVGQWRQYKVSYMSNLSNLYYLYWQKFSFNNGSALKIVLAAIHQSLKLEKSFFMKMNQNFICNMMEERYIVNNEHKSINFQTNFSYSVLFI